MRHFVFALLTLSFSLSSWAVEYERDIMPIFEKKCGECHSNASGKAKGGLKFDDPEHFHGRFAKNSVVVPGDWDASYLFITIYRPEGDPDAMPPKGKGGERLTPEEVTLVQKWITEGAPINGERGEKGTMPEEMPERPEQFGMEKAPVPKEWTNKEGKKIVATLLKVEGDLAVLRMSNGQVYKYPISDLSAESQAALKEE